MRAQKLQFIWLTVISLGLLVLGWHQYRTSRAPAASAKTIAFDEISVQRLNVVEPDGKPRVVISNRQRFPGVYWGGRQYRHASRDTGGLLFFNDEGDEVGGMTFDSSRRGRDTSANSSLTFDQYKQDQTVGLMYGEKNGQRSAGLQVWDRPDGSLLPLLELSDRKVRAKTDAERAAVDARIRALVDEQRQSPAERLFAGKQLEDTIVRLADRQGRTRLLLKVDGAGRPSIEFLDDSGSVSRRITDLGQDQTR